MHPSVVMARQLVDSGNAFSVLNTQPRDDTALCEDVPVASVHAVPDVKMADTAEFRGWVVQDGRLGIVKKACLCCAAEEPEITWLAYAAGTVALSRSKLLIASMARRAYLTSSFFESNVNN